MIPSTVGWATSAQLEPGKWPVDMPRHHSARGNSSEVPSFQPLLKCDNQHQALLLFWAHLQIEGSSQVLRALPVSRVYSES